MTTTIKHKLSFFLGNEPSKESEIAGVANTNVVVEQGMPKVDIWHTVLLIVILLLVVVEIVYLGFRHYQKQMKKKYLEMLHARRVQP